VSGHWANSTGPSRTGTRAWRTLRAHVLERDHGICHVCGQPGANEVDHVIPDHLGGTDDPDNLAPIHDVPCHRAKTTREATAARLARGTTRRPAETHPGLT
jgi:5-methylcytosine-specific restriction endonuclease McrA